MPRAVWLATLVPLAVVPFSPVMLGLLAALPLTLPIAALYAFNLRQRQHVARKAAEAGAL
jgi:hypothetical protein